jgi:hypothetical protein
MPRSCSPGHCPHIILHRGTLQPCGTRRMIVCRGPVLVDKGGDRPLFKSRQDADYCITRTRQIHDRLKASLMERAFWPNGVPKVQIMSVQKWVRLCEKPQ